MLCSAVASVGSLGTVGKEEGGGRAKKPLEKLKYASFILRSKIYLLVIIFF